MHPNYKFLTRFCDALRFVAIIFCFAIVIPYLFHENGPEFSQYIFLIKVSRTAQLKIVSKSVFIFSFTAKTIKP